MGAQLYTEIAKGLNVEEVFDRLVYESVYEHGLCIYNGTISTTTLGREVSLPKEINEVNTSELWGYFDEGDEKLFPSKRNTNYANLGVAYYEAFSPRWISDENKPKREIGVKTINRYTVMTKEDSLENRKSNCYKDYNLSQAKKVAKDMAVSLGGSVVIKKLRSNGDMFKYGDMILTGDGKEHVSPRRVKAKVYKPVYRFAFFVYAAD